MCYNVCRYRSIIIPIIFLKIKIKRYFMRIESLKLLNFRNYEHLDIKFHPKLNLIYGKNGSGKTNLVEAIYVLFLTRSFRMAQEKTLILDGKDASRIEGNVYRKSLINYRVYLSKEGKKVRINQQNIIKISDYISNMAIVLFHPDDLRFIKDAPSTRRKTLNISISLIYFQYLQYLNNYQNVLKQRNAYLKQMIVNANQSGEYLNILTEKLIEYGYYIYQKRDEFIRLLNPYLTTYYEKITGSAGLQLEYISSYHNVNKQDLTKLYQKGLEKDLKFGKTHIGIHMDDLRFLLDGKDLKDYGSEGQQKNAVIAYKFSELEIFKVSTGNYPILILDDLFSELDQGKIKNILELLKPEVQTFITTTELDHLCFLDQFNYKKFCIELGNIVEESEHETR